MHYWTTCVAAHVPPTLVANTLVISATSRCSGGSFGWFLEVNIYHSRQISISGQMLMLLLMLHCFVIYSLCHLVATPALFRRMSSLPWRVITVFTALGSKSIRSEIQRRLFSHFRRDAGFVVSRARAGGWPCESKSFAKSGDLSGLRQVATT